MKKRNAVTEGGEAEVKTVQDLFHHCIFASLYSVQFEGDRCSFLFGRDDQFQF
jgi:hypothetical protein